MVTSKTYLGDSVYAAWDGFHIVLTTENGVGVSNLIYLNSEVYSALLKYVERLQQKNAEAGKEAEGS